MFEIIVGFVIVLLILVFALVGFISFLSWIFGEKEPDSPAEAVTQKPALNADVLASRRLIDYLRTKNQINAQVYQRLRGFLDEAFPDQFEAPAPTSNLVNPPSAEKPKTRPPQKTLSRPTRAVPPVVAKQGNLKRREPLVIAEIVETKPVVEPTDSKTPEPDLPESTSTGSNRTGITPVPAAGQTSHPVKPAPWDLPDPPKPPPLIPRRSFAELMSGFMQEKNMRWGELTSGILIVLSAVGLVVSLREELNGIPYFSALLFMLITAAIHGAGIYTLKKWKLRNTSRGTLVIGLLLVPLNFIAACVLTELSDRRALDDPWLWTAIVVGLTVFSVMTWISSKHLLRRGQLPMTLAIMGCGVGALILNRTIETASSSLQYLLFALPVAASFLIGTCAFDSRQWVRQRWTKRASNRAYLYLGISVFAALATLSVVVVRADSKLMGLVSIAPILSVICIVTSWIGSIVSLGASQSKLLGAVSSTLADDPTSENNERDSGANENRVVGLSLKFLGLIVLVFSLIVSASNPTVFVINTMVAAIGLMAAFVHQRDEHLIPIAWGVFAVGALAAVNLATGTFRLNQWTSLEEIRIALVNGKSGLSLLAVGVTIAVANTLLQKQIPWLKDKKAFRIRGWITGGAVFLVGCLIALVASLLNRENVFDVMTASGLMMLGAIALLIVCVITDRKGITKAVDVSHFAALFLLGALAHTLLWNPTIAAQVNNVLRMPNSGWVAMLAVHSLVLIGLGVYLTSAYASRHGNDDSQPVRSSAGGFFSDWSALSSLLLLIGAVTLVRFQTGWATAFAGLACVNWLLIGWAWHRTKSELKAFASAPLILASGVFVSVAIAELASKTSWCPPVDSAKHWLVHLVGLSIWSILWSVLLSVVERRPRLKWLTTGSVSVEQVGLFCLVFAIGGFIFDSLIPGAAQELFASSSLTSNFGLADSPKWIVVPLIAVASAMMVSLIVKPTAYKGLALVVLWLLAWAIGADQFAESKSVATALRWLLPIGGAAGAVLIAIRRPILPFWSAARNQLGVTGPSCWRRKSTQQIINFALCVVAGGVLLISTITVSQVLLNGVGSLGGPAADSWFRKIPAEISFGVPVAIVVGTFLLYAVSERRPWLATIGSAVFQYVVVLAVVLLFISTHPKLASNWFINILKAVSIGMTGYGFVWFFLRERIEGQGSRVRPSLDSSHASIGQPTREKNWLDWGGGWISQMEVHTLINGLLITSLAVLAMGRFFFVPDQPGDWISTVGSPLGALAWAAFGVLAFCVWRDNLSKTHSASTWLWLIGWMGLILVGLAAAVIDRSMNGPESFVAWVAFRAVMIGATMVGLIQAGLIWWFDRTRLNSGSNLLLSTGYDTAAISSAQRTRQTLGWPVLLTGSIALTFAVRGAWLNTGALWIYIGVIALLAILATVIGWVLRDGKFSFVSAAVATIGVTLVVRDNPRGWFSNNQPDWCNLVTIVLAVISGAWMAYYVFQRNKVLKSTRLGATTVPGTKETPADRGRIQLDFPRSFLWLANVILLTGSSWIATAALLQFGFGNWQRTTFSSLDNPLGVTAFVAMVGLAALSLWNDRAIFRVFSWCLLSVAFAITIPSVVTATIEWRIVGVMIGIAAVVAGWGVVWLNRAKLFHVLENLGMVESVAVENSMRRQLPIYSSIMGGLALLVAWGVIFQFDERPQRYLAALVPFAFAISIGTQSNQSARRWMQMLTLGLATIGVLFLAWADLTQQQMVSAPVIRLLVRSLIVLSGAMFVYGGLVTRWVRDGDTWLQSLRQMAVVTCGLAIANLVLVLFSEASAFTEGVGCGLAIGESAIVGIVVTGMMVGLVVIALRPENDPFALSLKGRMGYVYAAEFVGLALIAHLYFSMPFLFQFGIKAYWPYLVMAICFGGVGIAQVLEKRNLTVLGQPLFNSAVVLPLIVAFAIFTVDSKAQPELVMLTVGLAYLMISYTHKSLLSGAGAIVFGNLALWLFFNKTDFSFLEHPQLWLIPPAISTLIASQLSRNSLTSGQLLMVRYVCVIVIYVSSTMEIFISGIGENLWPPVILAILSVIGILSGMMFRVKSFLYFGSLFLLMAMITMVAHAQQRLHHVWPWWAFGIGLGIAILVMFGLFEKKKKEMKVIADHLQEWEA